MDLDDASRSRGLPFNSCGHDISMFKLRKRPSAVAIIAFKDYCIPLVIFVRGNARQHRVEHPEF